MEPRIILSDDGKLAIAANLKCGYSTLNHALCGRDAAPGYSKAQDPARQVPLAVRRILFVRDPLARFLSFYRNWVIN